MKSEVNASSILSSVCRCSYAINVYQSYNGELEEEVYGM